ncbi:Mis12 domain containing protein [Amanita muscaria]
MTESNEQYLITSRPLLLPEALGFSPQLLLDDIINIANNAVQDGVNGMEEFLQNWTDKRIAMSPSTDFESIQEVEQGLVAFQTLLEYHTDIAFDFFEAWSLRNIFAIPPDLDVVLPHQEGLDLTIDKEKAEQTEKAIVDEIEELREKIDNQRLMKRQLTRALRVSSAQRRRAEQRLGHLSSLLSPSLDVFSHLPSHIKTVFETANSLPVLEPAVVSSVTRAPDYEAGKRPWEASKTGYLNWAVSRLVEKSTESKKERESGEQQDASVAVDKLRAALKELQGEGGVV